MDNYLFNLNFLFAFTPLWTALWQWTNSKIKNCGLSLLYNFCNSFFSNSSITNSAPCLDNTVLSISRLWRVVDMKLSNIRRAEVYEDEQRAVFFFAIFLILKFFGRDQDIFRTVFPRDIVEIHLSTDVVKLFFEAALKSCQPFSHGGVFPCNWTTKGHDDTLLLIVESQWNWKVPAEFSILPIIIKM